MHVFLRGVQSPRSAPDFHDTVSLMKQVACFVDYSVIHIHNAISMTYTSSILKYSPDLRQMLRGVSSQVPATLAGDTFNVCPILCYHVLKEVILLLSTW